MKKRNLEFRSASARDVARYTERGYIARNLIGFMVVVALLLITLTSQS
jgi:hypothetical protein